MKRNAKCKDYFTQGFVYRDSHVTLGTKFSRGFLENADLLKVRARFVGIRWHRAFLVLRLKT